MIVQTIRQPVGREFQHFEDLVYISGFTGTLAAVGKIRDIIKNPSLLELKWDASPSVIFGRDQNCNFHFADKFVKTPVNNTEELFNIYKNRKKEFTESRQEFANKMCETFSKFEQCIPVSFCGYYEAGLMFFERPVLDENNCYSFCPNIVTYSIKKDTDLGSRISECSTAGILTAFYKELNGTRERIRMVTSTSKDVLIITPAPVTHKLSIDPKILNDITSQAISDQIIIDEAISHEKGLSDVRAIVYSYVNDQTRNNNITGIGTNFVEWIEQNSKISENKKTKMLARVNKFKPIFEIFHKLSEVKTQIVNQTEKPTLDSLGINASINGAEGGEGLVCDDLSSPIKFVKRDFFTVRNMEKAR